MNLANVLVCIALVLMSVAPAQAQFGDVTVFIEFVVDPLIGGGGYNELTVVNDGATSVYAVVIGEDNSEVIYTSPALAGQWSPIRDTQSSWESGGVFRDLGFYTPPATNALDWNVYVGAEFSQVLAWQVTDTGTKIAPGTMLVGLRYLSGAGARAFRTGVGPLPFVAFDDTGVAVAQGSTVLNNPLPVSQSNFGRIKSLYR